ncbi:carbohydrate ABC transporter membrane protein 1 (CUT1 family) [Antricoccus suffuscus]|uniref:Carbohydrate ABC transporter membrane protein 1 (CUT1 family) n=1 Tax=Antricoccus suffuscus TaxID=1629062 RepID=A0A2T1A735_9ACTN|nr:sugar ABC transporter permease [Antricoccus suffuscus]PRZ44422.1 carbohydrate ABC transporter membrane protein 1 (CUT1 family) [Antricoccus suffuscus]
MLTEIEPQCTGAPTAIAAPPRARRRGWLRAAGPYLYLLPGAALLIVWVYRPLTLTAEISTYNWNLLPDSPAISVGLRNYERILEIPEVGNALWRTVVVIIGLIPFTILVPVVVGFTTRQLRGRTRRFYQGVIFLPFIIAPVIGAAVWEWLLDPRGALNQVTGGTRNWIHEPGTAQLAIIVITGWHILGFAMLVVFAGMKQIAQEYDDAAQLDGASRWQIDRWITLPLLSPTLVMLVLMTVLLSAQWTFPLIDTLTQGGPSGATTNVYYLLWDLGFHSFDAGLSAAVGIVLFIGYGVVAGGLVWLADRVTVRDD